MRAISSRSIASMPIHDGVGEGRGHGNAAARSRLAN
jgi:hypothetical protein